MERSRTSGFGECIDCTAGAVSRVQLDLAMELIGKRVMAFWAPHRTELPAIVGTTDLV